MEWKQVAKAFKQAKRQVEQQRQKFNENRNDSDRSEISSAKLRIKTGLDLPKPLRSKQEMVTRVRQNKLLPPSKNVSSLPSYNKKK